MRSLVKGKAAVRDARRASTWTIDEHLGGPSPECVAVDLRSPTPTAAGIGNQSDRASTTR
jgi:hypothetical protein